MKNLINNTTRHLEASEFEAIMQVITIMEKGFKKKIFEVKINPNTRQSDDVFGVQIAFDLTLEGFTAKG